MRYSIGKDDTQIAPDFEIKLTAWCRVNEKLTVAQLVKKFHTFYGT
jgi:hypothetical protein